MFFQSFWVYLSKVNEPDVCRSLNQFMFNLLYLLTYRSVKFLIKNNQKKLLCSYDCSLRMITI